MHSRWQESENARTQLRAEPSDKRLRKALKVTTKLLKRARTDGVQRVFTQYIRQLERRIQDDAQFGLFKHLEGVDVEGKMAFNRGTSGTRKVDQSGASASPGNDGEGGSISC